MFNKIKLAPTYNVLMQYKICLPYFLILLLLILNGCSDEKTVTNVQENPSQFEVKVESSLFTGSIISWSESFDPQNGSVDYSVSLQDNILVTNLSERTFQFMQLKTIIVTLLRLMD